VAWAAFSWSLMSAVRTSMVRLLARETGSRSAADAFAAEDGCSGRVVQ
jgi:hypothetical protein